MSVKSYYEQYWDESVEKDKDAQTAAVPSWPEAELNMFYRSVKEFIGKYVLDIGAGEGIFADFIKKNCKGLKSIEALEISANAIEKGRKNFPWLKYEQCSADHKLPYKNGDFDTLLMTDVIEHLLDVDMALSECNRILKKEGKLIIITQEFNFLKKMVIAFLFWERYFFPNNPHIRFFTRKSMKNIMAKHGFKEIYYRWGITWFRIMPQNMYVVYEKK